MPTSAPDGSREPRRVVPAGHGHFVVQVGTAAHSADDGVDPGSEAVREGSAPESSWCP